mgnify:CR=1 FL=1
MINWDWMLSAVLIAHLIGTFTFFFVALANMWIYNGQNRHNYSKKKLLTLFLMSNLWLKAWHSGIYGHFLTKPEDEDMYGE